jgi:hypothetical protein
LGKAVHAGAASIGAKDPPNRGHGAAESMKTALALLLLAGAGFAHAATSHVSRCASDDGAAIYTDGSCRAVGARPVPMSANLLRGLAREGVLGGDTNFRPTGTPQRAGGPGSTTARHQLGDAACPRTPAELASRLRASLGDGQVNRLASLYDWSGKSAREAQPILARLERMSERPLIDGQYFGDALSPDSGGTVQLVQGAKGAPTVTEIPVNRSSGCLLLAL